MKKIIVAFLLSVCSIANAQFSPGQLLTASALNATLAGKLATTGGTLTGALTVPLLSVTGVATLPNVAISGGSITALTSPIPVAAGGTGVATSTGSGSVVLSNSPTFTGSPTIPYSLTLGNTAATTQSGKLNQIVNFTDFGPTCDGSTNDNAAWTAAIAAIGSAKVTLKVSCPSKISSALTFAPNTLLAFEANGRIIGTSGTELVQTQSQILAGSTQVFSNVIAQADVGQTVNPAWFGAKEDGTTDDSAAFASAYRYLVNVGGTIRMEAGTYAVTGITATGSNIALIGSNNRATLIKVTGTNNNGISAIGVAGTPLAALTFRGFNIQSVTPGTSNTGIFLQYTSFARLSEIQIIDFFQGIYMQRATNSFFERMGASYSAATNGFKGWVIDGGGTGAGGNASSTWRDTFVQGSASPSGPTGQIGYRASGTYVSDLYFDNASTAQTNYGFYFDYTTATAGSYADVILQNPVVDGFTTQAIFADHIPAQQMLTVSDGWLNPAAMLAETDGVYCNVCTGNLQISGMQNGGENNAANAVGVRLISSTNTKISGNAFNDLKYALQESGSSRTLFVGNTVVNTSAHAATADVFMTGSAGAVVAHNSLDGYATTGVSIDATSSGVAAIANTINSTNITTPISNAGSGPIGGGYTGTGTLVLSQSPTLVTPALGTPSSATLTNATGLPIATGVSGLGAGVATGLASAATGTAGPVLATSPTITTPVITGVTDGSSAAAGKVGEVLVGSTGGTSITSGTTINATSLGVTAGDWDCWGQALFVPVASTVIANPAAGITTTSATLPASPDTTYLGTTLTTGTNGLTAINPFHKAYTFSSTTTVYLVAFASSITGSTATANGYLKCRRMR